MANFSATVINVDEKLQKTHLEIKKFRTQCITKISFINQIKFNQVVTETQHITATFTNESNNSTDLSKVSFKNESEIESATYCHVYN